MLPTERVLEHVAAAEDTEPAELEEALYERVDTDALDALFDSSGSGPMRDQGTVEFQYLGYEITVHADGEISVR